MTDLVMLLTIFVLAIFVGFEVITKVPPTLHTPLMSGSNAISGITIIGALILAGAIDSPEICQDPGHRRRRLRDDQRGRRLPGHPPHAGDVQRTQEVGERSMLSQTRRQHRLPRGRGPLHPRPEVDGPSAHRGARQLRRRARHGPGHRRDPAQRSLDWTYILIGVAVGRSSAPSRPSGSR